MWSYHFKIFFEFLLAVIFATFFKEKFVVNSGDIARGTTEIIVGVGGGILGVVILKVDRTFSSESHIQRGVVGERDPESEGRGVTHIWAS